jgi:hypothetical protein
MKWLFYSAVPHFEQFRKDWDVLNQLHNQNHILLDSRFVAVLLKHFGSAHTILAVNDESKQKGLALIQRAGPGLWSTFQPSQSPLGLFLSNRRDEDCGLLFSLMEALPRYAVLLSVLQQDPLYSPFAPASRKSNVEVIAYMDTPRLRLEGSFDQYWSQRSKNLRHNLDRQTRRAKEQGIMLELTAETRPHMMAGAVHTYGTLESAGWKAEGGTAISENNVQGRFYRELLEEFARTNEAVVYQLKLNERVVATDLCLRRNGMLVVLKTTYDENVEKLSPALLMRREITRQLYASGQTGVVEFYGRLRDWHKQWMTDARTMFHVNAFRSVYVLRARTILKRLR